MNPIKNNQGIFNSGLEEDVSFNRSSPQFFSRQKKENSDQSCYPSSPNLSAKLANSKSISIHISGYNSNTSSKHQVSQNESYPARVDPAYNQSSLFNLSSSKLQASQNESHPALYQSLLFNLPVMTKNELTGNMNSNSKIDASSLKINIFESIKVKPESQCNIQISECSDSL